MDTTVGDLKVGTQLVVGKYGVDKDSPYPIVWLKGNPNCDFITEKAVDFLCFDAAERMGTYRWGGNSRYAVSNLFSYLNSDQMDWYRPMHDNDIHPGASCLSYTRYAEHYGFLYFFDDHELASLVAKEYVVGDELVTSLIRLPSADDVYPRQDGRQFSLFAKRGIRPHPTSDLFDVKSRGARFNSEQGYCDFWLLDALSADKVMTVTRSGYLLARTTMDCAGVRPVCTLNPNTIVKQMGNGMYFIKPFATSQSVFTDEELFELLGMAQP